MNKERPEGRREKFEKLAFPYMDSLFNTALRLTRNRLDAEDLVQEVYLRAYRFLDKFEEGTNFQAWIFKILTNTFINRYRKKSREPHQVEFDKVEFQYSDGSKERDEKYETHYDESLYDELFDDEINSALAKLSYDFRAVVILCDIEGFAYKEIASILSIPIGTVMSRLSRARQQLQKQLGEYAQREGFVRGKAVNSE